MEHYNKHFAYCSMLMGMIGGGYNAAATMVRGQGFGNAVAAFGGFFVLFGGLSLFTFGLIGMGVCPPDREPSSVGIRSVVAIGCAIAGIIAGAIIENL